MKAAAPKAPGATAIAPGAESVDLAGATHLHTPKPSEPSSCHETRRGAKHRASQDGGKPSCRCTPENPDVMPAVLFEQSKGRDLWRFEVATHDGRTFVQWRKWWLDHGTLKPSQMGFTFALERLAELEGAISDWRRTNLNGEALRSS